MLLALGNYIHVRLRLIGLIYAATLIGDSIAAKYEFDACELANRSPGICRIFQECQSLIDALKRHEITINDPIRCGFKGDNELVCCPGSGGNLDAKGGEPTFDENGRVDATSQKSVDYSVLLPTTATTTAKPDFWLHLLNSTTTTTSKPDFWLHLLNSTTTIPTTTSKPDFWLHLLNSTTTTTTTAKPDFWLHLLSSTTTTTTTRPLVVDGVPLDADAQMYDFSKLLNQNKKSDNLQIGEQNPMNSQPNFSENERENWSGNDLDSRYHNVPQSVNVNGAENRFVAGTEYPGDFRNVAVNVPGPGFGNGRGHRQRNGFGIGLANGQGNGFGIRNGRGHGFMNGPWQQGTQFQNRHFNNPLPSQGQHPLTRPNLMQTQFQQRSLANDGIGANLFSRPSLPQSFSPGIGPAFVGKGFANGPSGSVSPFQNQHANMLRPLQDPPIPVIMPSQHQQQAQFVNETQVNSFLASPLPTVDQNHIDMSESNNLLFGSQLSTGPRLTNDQIWDSENRNFPVPNSHEPVFHAQANEGYDSEFQPNFYDNMRNTFSTSTAAEQPALTNPFPSYEYRPQANEYLPSSAINFNADYVDQ